WEQLFVIGGARKQLDDPLLKSSCLFGRTLERLLERRAGALDEERSQIGIPASGDGAQAGFAAAGELSGCEAPPGAELPAIAEFASVADRGDYGVGGGGSDAHGLLQAPGGGVRAAGEPDGAIAGGDALVEELEVL